MRMSKLVAAGFFLVGTILVSAGCTERVTYYDEEHHDYHRWNNHEVVVYHSYWDTHHQPYREYSSLNKDEQRDYWRWRHDHQ
jgi:hypothetical protein